MITYNNKQALVSIIEQSNVFRLAQFEVAIPKGLWFKPHSWNFDFIKISAQIVSNFLKVSQNEK